MDDSRLVLICTGHETAFARLDTQDTISINFPAYTNAEMGAAITQQIREWPDAISPDALTYLASSVCPATLSNGNYTARLCSHSCRRVHICSSYAAMHQRRIAGSETTML